MLLSRTSHQCNAQPENSCQQEKQSQGLPDTKWKICCQRIPGAETAHANFTGPEIPDTEPRVSGKRQNKKAALTERLPTWTNHECLRWC